MYDELVKMLRTCALIHGQCAVCYYHGNPCNALTEIPLAQAADAIEELKKALDAVNDAHNEGYDVGYWAGRRDYEPKWIPVTERLPEENGRYLVRYKRDIVLDYTEVHDDEVRIMRFFVGTGWRYPFLCQPELRAAEQQTVTHWMPLPEPPEEVTQDD